MTSRLIIRLSLLAALLLLAACSKITEQNYAKLQDGMSQAQVQAILGTPTETSSATFGPLSGTSMIWRDKNVEIRVQFFNDKLKLKDLTRGD